MQATNNENGKRDGFMSFGYCGGNMFYEDIKGTTMTCVFLIYESRGMCGGFQRRNKADNHCQAHASR